MASKTQPTDRARARRRDMEQRIRDAIERLMADGAAYTELPVQQIAEAAQVPRSTFYLHFPDKSQLLIAIARDAVEELTSSVVELWENDSPHDSERLEQGVSVVVANWRRHARVIAALLEVAAYDDDVAAAWQATERTGLQAVERRLAVDQSAGRIEADVDVELTARLLIALGTQTLDDHCATMPEQADPVIVRQLTRAMWLIAYGRTSAN